MKFGERQTHAVGTDEWPGRGRKRKSSERRGRVVGDGGGPKGKKQPPMEREGGELRKG